MQKEDVEGEQEEVKITEEGGKKERGKKDWERGPRSDKKQNEEVRVTARVYEK